MPADLDIKNMKIQGARNIAIFSLLHLRRIAKKNGLGKGFFAEAAKLEKARPTAVMLHNCIRFIRKEKNPESIDYLLGKVNADTKSIGSFGEKLIRSGYQVHVHCHSNEVIEIIRAAAKNRRFSVIVDETRPLDQGIMTARDIANYTEATLIVDSAIGFFASGLSGKKDDLFLVGADAIRKDGVVNKIGTYQLALAAKENNIPLFVAASTMKLDRRKNIVIEMRASDEVLKRKRGDMFSISNPAFDITPWKLVKAVITERGILSPEKIKRLLKN